MGFGVRGSGVGGETDAAEHAALSSGGTWFDTFLNLRTTSSQKCEAVPKRARIYGS